VLDYYEILGLEPSCTRAEIKRAFRAKAKDVHPDRAGAAGSGAMRDLIDAYRVLSDDEARKAYDAAWRSAFAAKGFDYRAFLKERAGDPAAMTKLVFYDMLHGLEDEALATWDGLCADPRYSVAKYLDREDSMDLGFLIAELLEERGRRAEAFIAYRDIALMEAQKPYFRHFYVEVQKRIMALLRAGDSGLGATIYDAMLESALGVELPAKDRAWCARRIKERAARNSRSGAGVV
jgi:curved DNA-binding protein CbpA